MNKCQTSVTRSDVGCYSNVAEKQERNDENKGTNENEKFISQIECLKKSLKMRVEELQAQQEFMRDLEEELTKTKLDLSALQDKYDSQDRHSQPGESDTLKPDINKSYETLTCVANKIEGVLRNLSTKQTCGLQNCKALIKEEMQKISSIKNDLEKGRAKVRFSASCDRVLNETLEDCGPCISQSKSDAETKPSGDCNLVHVEDVEKFKEKAVTGVVALEQMKEQIDILENLIKGYIEEFPCFCDKNVIEQCEEKLGQSRTEFDNVTYHLCRLLQKITNPCAESCGSISFDETVCKEDEQDTSQENLSAEEICKLKSECQRLQKQICDQGNESEKLKRMAKQLDEEIKEKRLQLIEHTREMESKMCEIYKLREIVRNVTHILRDGQCHQQMDESTLLASPRNMSNLSGLFCDLQEFRCVLEKSTGALFEDPKKLMEENQALKEKLECLEKCVCNKDETVRVLQDTMKLRECQIEELTYRMQTSETNSSKLAQDVEDKCRLISNLQDAVRKCKQFEDTLSPFGERMEWVNMELIESLRFEYCELECKLEKYEKEVLLKDQKLDRLHREITDLSSRNSVLTEKIKIMNPKLKIMYKTCHLFEKMVTELQDELNNRECEIENLYEKIKSLEAELDAEFKKYEEKSAEDSKCIEDLSLTVKNFQNELFCAQENYNMSIAETENKLKRELEMRECELNNTICQLTTEINQLKNQMQSAPKVASPKIPDNMRGQPNPQIQMYEKKISELQDALECIALEHEEEKKNIVQLLCDEKKENMKNKSTITKLNECIKRKIINEKTLEECISRFTDDIDNLKTENQHLCCELEARKRIISAMENDETPDMSELEELICSLKIQKSDLKARCCNLKAEVEKEVKLKKHLECRVGDLNATLQTKIQEFNLLVDNYKSTSVRIQATHTAMKDLERKLLCSENSPRMRQADNEVDEYNCLKNLLDVKTAENGKLFCEIQVLKVEMEKIQTENAAARANKDAAITRLHHEVECLENDLQEFQGKCHRLSEENRNLIKQLDCSAEKNSELENGFREKQKDLAAKLRTTMCEKNDLLKSLVELQKQLEQMCLDSANKEKIMRDPSTGRMTESSDGNLKSKSEKVICNLTKEVKTLHSELIAVKENFSALNEEYQSLLEEFKCCEKKKCNLEKLYIGVTNENRELAESKAQYERELCELQAQNCLLKDKISKENFKIPDDKKKLCDKIRELTQKIKTLETKIIPELEQEISDKMCCIENLKIELKEANLSSQRMRNEALRVIQHTRKYLAAQRFANDSLKTRLECSNKRGNMLGIENRELEEQLKAVTRMNEFLLCQLESNKNDVGEAEPRSVSPLPWGCSTVERDTSSSEYLAESGFQSMQPSPTNMDYQDPQFDSKRNCCHWGGLKKNKYGGSVEYPSHRNGVR